MEDFQSFVVGALPTFPSNFLLFIVMIIHLYVKPSTLMDNTPRESLAKIDRDQSFSLSANIDTNFYKLEWEDESQGILRVVKRIPIIFDTD